MTLGHLGPQDWFAGPPYLGGGLWGFPSGCSHLASFTPDALESHQIGTGWSKGVRMQHP